MNIDKIDKLEQMKQMMMRKKQQKQKIEKIQTNPPVPSVTSVLHESSVQLSSIPAVGTQKSSQQSQKQKESVGQNEKKQQAGQVKPSEKEKQKSPLNPQIKKSQLAPPQLELQKAGIKYFSQTYSGVISSNQTNKLSIDQAVRGQKQKEVKLTRFTVKDIDKLKQAIGNIDGALKGIDYIRKRVKYDKEFKSKIKDKIQMLRENCQRQ